MTPVVQTLIASYPEISVAIRSAHPDHVVHDLKGSPVELDQPSLGAMLISRDPITIGTTASTEHLDRETARLAALSPDVFVAGVPCCRRTARNSKPCVVFKAPDRDTILIATAAELSSPAPAKHSDLWSLATLLRLALNGRNRRGRSMPRVRRRRQRQPGHQFSFAV